MKNAADMKDWFQEFKAGNNLAFRHYFDQYYQLLFYIAYRIVQENEAAKDIVSDTFQKLWENREKIQTETHIGAFLRAVSRNLSLNYIKREERKLSSEEELRYLNDDLEKTDLVNDLVAAEMTKRLYDAIESLPRKCKAVFKLLYYEQASTREVAEKLGITERNVLNQKSRAILLLRGILTSGIIILKYFLAI